jgi:arabinofuranosyltransferase
VSIKFSKSFGTICLVLGLGLFIFFMQYTWNFIADDSFIAFRFAKNWAEGNGIVWNVGEFPLEGYVNFLWILIVAVFHILNFDPVIATKIIGVFSAFGILYLYRTISLDVYKKNPGISHMVFGMSSALFLANPATTLHISSGLETMLFSLFVLSITYFTYRLIIYPHKNQHYSLFISLALFGSLLRPEGILLSLTLIILLYYFSYQTQYNDNLKINRIKVSMIVYIVIIIIYQFLRISYFQEYLPLPVIVKILRNGPISRGFSNIKYVLAHNLSFFSLYLASFFITVTIILSQFRRVFWDGQNEHFTSQGIFLLTVIIGFISTNIIYIFSNLQMNYAQRFFYPSFVLIYISSSLSLGNLHWNKKGVLKAEKIVQYLAIVFIFFSLLTVNVNYETDLRWAREYSITMDETRIKLGNILNEYESYNLTFVSQDAGAVPYYSEWTHIDLFGLTDKTIAKNTITVFDYIEQKNPHLIILTSADGKTPYPAPENIPLISFIQENDFVQIAVLNSYPQDYIIYLDSHVEIFFELKADINKIQ